jgi:hypothetical protein
MECHMNLQGMCTLCNANGSAATRQMGAYPEDRQLV